MAEQAAIAAPSSLALLSDAKKRRDCDNNEKCHMLCDTSNVGMSERMLEVLWLVYMRGTRSITPASKRPVKSSEANLSH